MCFFLSFGICPRFDMYTDIFCVRFSHFTFTALNNHEYAFRTLCMYSRFTLAHNEHSASIVSIPSIFPILCTNKYSMPIFFITLYYFFFISFRSYFDSEYTYYNYGRFRFDEIKRCVLTKYLICYKQKIIYLI